MDLLSGTVSLAKNYLQVAIIKIKSATIAFFFSFSPFLNFPSLL